MALTPLRWFAAAIAGALILGGVILTEWPERSHGRDDVAERLYATTRLLRERRDYAATRFRTEQAARAAEAVVARDTRAGAVRVSYAPTVAPVVRAALDSTVARAAARLTPRAPGPRINVVATSDSGRFAYGRRVSYVLPRRAGEDCTVIVQLDYVRWWTGDTAIVRVLSLESTASRLFGPCAFYHEFGMPGRHVVQWLGHRGVQFARDNDFDRAPLPAPLHSSAWVWGEPEWFPGEEKQAASPYYTPTPLTFVGELDLAGVRCLDGETAACLRLATQPRMGWLVLNGNRTGPVDLFDVEAEERFRYASPLGYRGPYLLANMVHQFGRERFAAFWRSDDPVDVAFKTATGEDLGSWVGQWMRDVYGLPVVGPRMSAAGVLSGTLLFALGILFAIRSARVRQLI